MPMTRLAQQLREKPAVIMSDTGKSISYAALEAESNQIAHLFRQRGLKTGDRVAFIFGNQLEGFPVYWAAQRTGLRFAPVNWHLTADEAAYIVDNSEAQVLIFDAAFSELAAQCASASPNLTLMLSVGGKAEGAEELTEAISGLPTTPVADEIDGIMMPYSSGTTGRPKGIIPGEPSKPFGAPDPHHDRLGNAYGLNTKVVLISPGPIYHAAPFVWSMSVIRNGGTLVMMPKFDAESLLDAIERHRVTHLQVVPTMMVRMLKLPDEVRTGHDLSSLRSVLHAAAPCPPDVKRAMIDWLGPIIGEYYSGSEGIGMTAISSEEWLAHPGSVGRSVEGVLHISNDGETELPAHEVGTIWFSGGASFAYYKEQDKTDSAHSPLGWATFGDMGYVDEEGYLYIADRRTDLILSGGVNIYPREVEDVLGQHPAVADVGVVGKPHDEMGQSVHAVVQLTEPASAGPDLADELIAFTKGRIASFKAPRSIEFRESLPRLPSGKLLRRNLLDVADVAQS